MRLAKKKRPTAPAEETERGTPSESARARREGGGASEREQLFPPTRLN